MLLGNLSAGPGRNAISGSGMAGRLPEDRQRFQKGHFQQVPGGEGRQGHGALLFQKLPGRRLSCCCCGSLCLLFLSYLFVPHIVQKLWFQKYTGYSEKKNWSKGNATGSREGHGQSPSKSFLGFATCLTL